MSTLTRRSTSEVDFEIPRGSHWLLKASLPVEEDTLLSRMMTPGVERYSDRLSIGAVELQFQLDGSCASQPNRIQEGHRI
jgi:hypothetical protein